MSNKYIEKGWGFVYFLKAEGLPVVKIGRTKNVPKERIKNIQSMSPVKLHTLACFATERPQKMEEELHMIFADKRLHGEWFELDSSITSTIKSLVKRGIDTREFFINQYV